MSTHLLDIPVLIWRSDEDSELTQIPLRESTINTLSPGLNYGLGTFEGIRAYWSEDKKGWYIFRLIEHYERLRASWRSLYMKIPFAPKLLANATVELVSSSGLPGQDLYIRPLAFKDGLGIGCKLHDWETRLVIMVVPLEQYLAKSEMLDVVISPWRRVPQSSIPVSSKPTGAYLQTALAVTHACMSGYDDAIILNQDGTVSEFSAANIFVIRRNGEVVTPPPSANILIGLTRDTIMVLLREEMDIVVKETSIGVNELLIADTIFGTGTAWEIATVNSVNNIAFKNSAHLWKVKKLKNMYTKILRGDGERWSEIWCTFAPDENQ